MFASFDAYGQPADPNLTRVHECIGNLYSLN